MTERELKFHSSNGKRRILVIEDELINQEMLRFILGETYDVVVAGTGEEAFAEVREHYDILSLILLDLNLPDMHGLDVLRRIKRDARFAALPVQMCPTAFQPRKGVVGLCKLDLKRRLVGLRMGGEYVENDLLPVDDGQ